MDLWRSRGWSFRQSLCADRLVSHDLRRKHVWLISTRDDELSQIAIDEYAPGIRAGVVTFKRRRQAFVCEADFCLAVLPRDIKDNVRALPLAPVFHETEVGVQHVPDDGLSRNEFRDLLLGTVHILVSIRELGSKSIGVPFDFS